MKLRLHFVVDPTGWLCIGLVFGIWLYNTFFIPTLVLLPHYNQGHIPWAAVVCYYVASALCMAALFRASTADPGRLPVDPHIPHSEREHWELCNKCNLMRPKRSHHCSRCGHCVRRMDHHCPWILPPLRKWLSSQMKYTAPRDPGSGPSLKSAALAGNSCGSSRCEPGRRSKPATTSAPTCRWTAPHYLPPAQMTHCMHTFKNPSARLHCPLLCSGSSVRQWILDAFIYVCCCCWVFFCPFSTRPRPEVNRVKKHFWERWGNVSLFFFYSL
uniref:Palmitoyltransferase n=1 Tax=Scophthalmus maximus TaxID=52904 RepID=A0A8D3BAU4_SCOMX